MAITRDLWIVLRARDEASRIIRSFGNNVAGSAAMAASNMSTFEQRMAQLGLRMQQFAMTSMLAGTALAGVGAAGLGFIKSAADVAVAYEKQVRATKTQVDDLGVTLQDLADVGRRVARQVEIPFEQMQETLFFIFSSMNVTLAESEQLLKGFAKEAVAGQTSIDKAARSNIAIMNSLGLTTKDLGRIQDVQFQIVRKGVITYEELSEVIGRALPAAARSGQSIETLGAMMAFLTRNGLSAAMASASAARALESFAHPTTVKRLEEIGIKVRDARGEFLPLLEVMTQLNKKLQDMAQPERAKFFQELFKGAGGTIQARRFWDTAFKNFGDFQEMMGFMANSAGVFENAYENMANSVANKSVLLQNKWELIKETLGRAVIPNLLKFMNLLGQLLDWFDRLPEPTKNLIAQFILWGSIISIAVGALIIFIGVLAFFVSGIMMAGTALVYILAAITGVTAAVIGLGAAINSAWQSSESFRQTVTQIGKEISGVWNLVVDTIKRVTKSFQTELMPALEKVWATIQSSVLPAIRKFVDIWKEDALPKLQEAGRIIQDVFGTVFRMAADIINNVLIPSLKKLADWWKENADTIRPFLDMAAQVVKWLLIIFAVLIAGPILVFVAAISALVAVIYGLVVAFKAVWDWVSKAMAAVKKFFADMGQAVMDAFNFIKDKVVSAWENFVQTIKDGINKAKEIIAGVLQSIYDNVWVPFWNTFGGLIKEVWGLITDIVKFFTTLIQEIIKDWILPLIALIIAGWHVIVDGAKELWQRIYNNIVGWVTLIWNFIKPIWEFIRDLVMDVWNTIKDFVVRKATEIWNFLKPFFDGIGRVASETWEGLKKGAKNAWDSIVDFFSGGIRGIKDFFANAGKWLFDAGKGIIQGLIDGLTDKVKDLRAWLKKITDDIPNWKGPRSVDIRLLVPVGKNIMQGFIDGILSQVPMIKAELQGLTAQLGQLTSPTVNLPTLALAGGISQERQIIQNITIHTQEINPRINAEELGFELGDRL